MPKRVKDPVKLLINWMELIEDLQDDLERSTRRLGYAIWVLVLFEVVVTYALLTLLK